MAKLKIARRYVSIGQASELLGASASDLIHAGSQGGIQICANIYGRSIGQVRKQCQSPDDIHPWSEIDPAELKALEDWWNRCTLPMPDGIFEVGNDALRFLEMPETRGIQLHEGYKRDESGWWDVEFDPPVSIDHGDLVILSEEIERVTAYGGFDTAQVERPVMKRERDTLLTIIAVLCNEAKIDYTKPAKAAGLILGTADRMGVSIGESTIEGHLKKIPDALGTRMK